METHSRRNAPGRHFELSRHFKSWLPRQRVDTSLVVALVVACLTVSSARADASGEQIARGKYLVSISGCNDCHTPGYFLGKPDAAKYLAGSDVGFAIPGLGVFVGPNLTPDKETGLGNFTAEQIVTAITKGESPRGRGLVRIMPWEAFASLTETDALAIAAYLKSLPPVKNQVPGPFGETETPAVLVLSVQPGNVYARLPKPDEPAAAGTK